MLRPSYGEGTQIRAIGVSSRAVSRIQTAALTPGPCSGAGSLISGIFIVCEWLSHLPLNALEEEAQRGELAQALSQSLWGLDMNSGFLTSSSGFI